MKNFLMSAVLVTSSMFTAINAHAGLKFKSSAAAYTYETKDGKSITPTEAIELAMKGVKIYKITTKEHSKTETEVEAVVNEKGTVSLKPIK